MSEWTKIVTSPLGLAAFALFLLFLCLAKIKRSEERRWVTRVFVSSAVTALVGGLALAYFQVTKPVPPSVQQTSTGQGSPNVQGVHGDVTITVDQSKGKTEIQKVTEKPESDPRKSAVGWISGLGSFVAANWDKLWTLVLVPIGGWCVHRWRKRRRRTTPRPGDDEGGKPESKNGNGNFSPGQ